MQAFADWFASNNASGSGPTSWAELEADPVALKAVLNAHLVPGQRLWLWDLLNMATLPAADTSSFSRPAKVTTADGRAYTVRRVDGSWSDVDLVGGGA